MLIRRHQEVYGNTIEMKPALDENGDIIDVPANNNNSNSFKFKQQITGKFGNGGKRNVEIMSPLKYISNLWRTLEMP